MWTGVTRDTRPGAEVKPVGNQPIRLCHLRRTLAAPCLAAVRRTLRVRCFARGSGSLAQPSDEQQAATQAELRSSHVRADMRLLAKERIMMRKVAIWSGRRSSDSGSLFSRGPLPALFSRIRSCCVEDGLSTGSFGCCAIRPASSRRNPLGRFPK